LTVAQLATCIKKASKLDEDNDRLEAIAPCAEASDDATVLL
jgi:hypothetical protein